MAWRAYASYEDGFEVNGRLFESNAKNYREEEEEVQRIEAWCQEYHDGCVWYSVNWIDEE